MPTISKHRAIIVHPNGLITLADATENPDDSFRGTLYDLDKAFQEGAGIVSGPYTIGDKGTVLLIIDEHPHNRKGDSDRMPL